MGCEPFAYPCTGPGFRRQRWQPIRSFHPGCHQGASAMKLSNLSIGARLGATFALLACAVVAVSTFALNSLGASDDRFGNFVEGIDARAAITARLRTAVDVRAISARNLVLVSSPQDVEIEKALVVKAHADVQ